MSQNRRTSKSGSQSKMKASTHSMSFEEFLSYSKKVEPNKIGSYLRSGQGEFLKKLYEKQGLSTIRKPYPKNFWKSKTWRLCFASLIFFFTVLPALYLLINLDKSKQSLLLMSLVVLMLLIGELFLSCVIYLFLYLSVWQFEPFDKLLGDGKERDDIAVLGQSPRVPSRRIYTLELLNRRCDQEIARLDSIDISSFVNLFIPLMLGLIIYLFGVDAISKYPVNSIPLFKLLGLTFILTFIFNFVLVPGTKLLLNKSKFRTINFYKNCKEFFQDEIEFEKQKQSKN
jgi:hypothetical protein